MKLAWDEDSKRLYETGVSKAVLYPMAKGGTYPKGYAWNGVSSVKDTPSGAEAKAVYANNSKYLSLLSNEELGGTVEAYTYPDEFAKCDGSAEISPGILVGQQERQKFGLCYRTVLGNDTEGNAYGYKLHIIYNATASPSEKQYQTINDSPEAITFSWELSTTPTNVDGHKPTASLVIDSTKVDETKLKKLEDKLYGTESAEASLPTPNEIIALLAA